MKLWTFSVRTAKEILRDPLNLGFGLGFPLILILNPEDIHVMKKSEYSGQFV